MANTPSSIDVKSQMHQSEGNPTPDPYADVIDFEQKGSLSLFNNRNYKGQISIRHTPSVIRPINVY